MKPNGLLAAVVILAAIGGGIYFNQSNTNLQITPYGNTRPNFSSPQVRSFVQDNFTMWLDECHVDGFRWDTPGLMMNANNYGYIPDAGSLINGINGMIHSNYTGRLSISEDVYGSFGFDSAWDTAAGEGSSTACSSRATSHSCPMVGSDGSFAHSGRHPFH